MGRAVTLQVRLDAAAMRAALLRDAFDGLVAAPRTLSPVWFYDPLGCDLFDRITRLEEYYPTRAEHLLLVTHAGDIATMTSASTLIELGAGTCTKTRILLDALRATGSLRDYVALDVAEPTLWNATNQIAHDYPDLDVTAMVADFHDLSGLLAGEGPKLVAFLGGTIGNFEPSQRASFFRQLGDQLDPGDFFLLGTDLVKDRGRLVAAYDDAQGVTAAFNRNILTVINRELGADFDPGAFSHVAVFDEERQWIEMRLRATADQHVSIPGLALDIDVAAGEELRTEISAKFTAEGIAAELGRAGFGLDGRFDQPGGDFLLTLAHVEG